MNVSPAPSLAATLLVLAGRAAAAGAVETPAAVAPAGFNVLGRADAPVVILEFSDLQCPFCARYALQTFPELKRNYIDTGKVRYVARDLPLPMHAYAIPAAVAVRCAGDQGRFWEFREALFARQADLAQAPYDAVATQLALDLPRFQSCRSDGRAEAEVRADVERAQSLGITATPSFLIGEPVEGGLHGEKLTGAKPYAEFAQRIDAALEAVK